MKIGLLFGSFNPIHIGHLIVANHILNETDIEKVWIVVSPQNPFKAESNLLNEYHRLHLVRIATEDDNRIKASDIEFQLPKPSYTANTLIYLAEKYPDKEFCIIMGSDSFRNLGSWKNWETIIKNYEIYVYLRPGFDFKNDKGAKAIVVKAPLLQISATELRNNIKKGKSIRYMVPDKVLEEIERGGYYK
ncbi:MAG: nicotinate-nucleotide adenylyltransferase [Sphingobacteriales bacterium]|nr:nicotinate-nucleotide adenylyltransferase [Sphingobacteriales bacterium]